MTLNTSPKVQLNLPLKINIAEQTTVDTRKPSKFADDKKTPILSHATLECEAKSSSYTTSGKTTW
ncbi:hypothetical protein BHOIPH791_04790 [Bartonella henselae]|uniref:hypothetical protein n=1 Tax=Bartonella henselae TaxID=38323 RepID=UPI0003190F06|nr:hypothetical protein [Bartonella henselae]MDM9995071.1 hypothetical protein [Bartonella henselae]UJM39372.1 hypothetical protein KAE72_03215 [Bartonella henselae]GFF01926.1 hypothetical protein BH623125_03600 [Bartonella henselae]GFF04333.1 hypothetical protein BH80429_11540 [Bartonella henselae]